MQWHSFSTFLFYNFLAYCINTDHMLDLNLSNTNYQENKLDYTVNRFNINMDILQY
jgi:hypothetical protein